MWKFFNSLEALRKLCPSVKFSHQEIRCILRYFTVYYGILHSSGFRCEDLILLRFSLQILNDRILKTNSYCKKGIRVGSFSGPYFPAFGLNTEKYRISLRIKSQCSKIRTRKTPNTDTFHVVKETCLKSKYQLK